MAILQRLRRVTLLAVLAFLLGLGLVAAPLAGWTAAQAATKYTKPTGLKATVSAHAVALTWTKVKKAPAYRVQFSTTSAMSTFVTMDVVANYLQWTNLDMDPASNSARLSANTTYYFRVKVLSLAKATLTSYSKTLAVKTAAAKAMPDLAPVSLKATKASTTSMYLSWSSAGPGVAYRIRYGTTSKLQLDKSKLAPAAYSGTVLSGLKKGTRYYYKVRVMTADAKSARSNYSATRSFTTPKSYNSPAIKIATYNLCSSPCGNWATSRGPAAVAAIAGQSPDLLALEEISTSKLPAFLADLNKASGGRNYTSTDPSNQNLTNTTRLVYDANRFSMAADQHGYLKLPLGNSTSQKYAVWAVLTDLRSGKKFFALSTHLIAGADYQPLRKTQTQEIVALIKAKNTGKLPVLVGGDFNSGKSYKPSNVIYDVMRGAGYKDPLGNTNNSWTVSASATSEHRIDLDYNSFEGFATYAPRSKYSNGHDIDYIWHSASIRVAMTQVLVHVDTDDKWIGVVPSDHNMLLAWVHLH